jgi:hypothetical protein
MDTLVIKQRRTVKMKEIHKEEKQYKSPQRKLVKFFEKSRDQWKDKCLDAKTKIRRFSNRIRFLEGSKKKLKNQVKELKAEISRMKSDIQEKEDEFELLKKKTGEKNEKTDSSGYPEEFGIVPFRHTYSVGQILLSVLSVLSGATGFRGAETVTEIFVSVLGLPFSCPSWSSVRMWLLRLGYYKLTRLKEKADDWVWIVDHTIQTGAEKCLVILGIRLSHLPCPERCLSLEDLEPVELIPVRKSNGEVVWQQLEDATKKTGIPRVILGDQGSDLKAGIEKFCQNHPGTAYLYDIKHKTAAALKHELEKDEAWQEFAKSAAQAKLKLQQTPLAPLGPPAQRSKSRYMNADKLVGWGRNILNFFDKDDHDEICDEFGWDQNQIDEKLGWADSFRDQTEEWEEAVSIVKITENFVRKNGLYDGCCSKLEEYLPVSTETELAKKIRDELVSFVAEEELKVRPDERLPGSSEVIESAFGKFKRIEQDQAKSGFTGLLLGIAAMVSSTTGEVVRQAMEKVPVRKVHEWYEENIGQSVQSKRKKAFAPEGKTEQKRDQLCGTG